MTNLGIENLCADSEQAKRRAKSIKARMKELGYEMPLTHAYEALASSCGFRNWPTMKAQLQAGVSMPGTVSILDDLSFSFAGDRALVRSLSNASRGETELIYALPGRGKTTLACALALSAIKRAAAEGKQFPYMRIVDVGPSARGFFETLKEALPSDRKGDAVYLKPDKIGACSLNPFDLPLGFRQPPAHRLSSLVNFLMCMSEDKRFMADSERVKVFLETAVTQLYAKFSDQGGGEPKLFDPEAHPALTREIRKLCMKFGANSVTWWEVVDGLAGIGRFDLANIAQRYAVPNPSDLVLFLHEMDGDMFLPIRSLIYYFVSSCPILAGPTNMDSANPRIVIVDLMEFGGPSADVLAARVAFLAARLGVTRDLYLAPEDWVGLHGEFPSYHRRHYEARKSDDVQVIYDELHRYYRGVNSHHLMNGEFLDEMNVVKERGFNLRLISQLRSVFDAGIIKGVARELVLGLLSRDLPEYREEYQLSEDTLASCMQQLIGPGKMELPFAVFSKHTAVEEPCVSLKLDGFSGWALASSEREAFVRGRLGQLVGFKRALKCLADRFPEQNVSVYIERQARQKASTSSEYSYRDLIDPVTEALISELAGLA